MFRAFRPELVPRSSRWMPFSLPAQPLDLEIGAGAGLHAIQYALENPERHLVAIERTANKFDRFVGRLHKHPEIENVTAVRADARHWVTHQLPENSVERVFILYPNPNPKNPAQRWARMPFMQQLLRVMKPQAELVLATNMEWYFCEARQAFSQEWGLSIRRAELLSPHIRGRSHFERKYLGRGERCFELVGQKTL